MDKKFQIGEIARFFDIPASTFRYWEEKGILHPRKKIENQYREYAIEDLMTISDVIFYKNLGCFYLSETLQDEIIKPHI